MSTFLGGVILAAVLFVGWESAEASEPKAGQSRVRLSVAFPEWSRNQSKSEAVITFSNPTTQPRTVVLPCPFRRNATHHASPDRPTLVLDVREPSAEDDEKGEPFILMEFDDKGTSGAAKTLTLKPGESAKVSYALESFLPWTHGGPMDSESFLRSLRPGKRDFEVRAFVLFADPDATTGKLGEHLVSPPVVLKCDVPQWLRERIELQRRKPSADAKNSPK